MLEREALNIDFRNAGSPGNQKDWIDEQINERKLNKYRSEIAAYETRLGKPMPDKTTKKDEYKKYVKDMFKFFQEKEEDAKVDRYLNEWGIFKSDPRNKAKPLEEWFDEQDRKNPGRFISGGGAYKNIMRKTLKQYKRMNTRRRMQTHKRKRQQL